MRLTVGNLQTLLRLAAHAEGDVLDVREDQANHWQLVVRYRRGLGGGGQRKEHVVVVNRRDSTVTVSNR